uniref:Uncharacterized protein n=1 Tax=Meloidogyne enterolobii TaxID=390850 RepID=A0A6V7W8U5_MELEN|nr:unnamed protein product [Meloidogyne enterolobii]
MEFLKTLFDKWIDLTKNSNFELLMASPFNKLGGHIQAIIVAVGTGKGEGEEDEKVKAKQIFNGEPETFCEPPFVYNCPENSFFCFICKKSLHETINNVHRSSSSDDKIYLEINETEFEIFFVYKEEQKIPSNDTKWIETLMRKIYKNLNKEGLVDRQQNSSILYNLSLFKTFEYLENLLKNKNEKEKNIFNQSFIYLKNWAKGTF